MLNEEHQRKLDVLKFEYENKDHSSRKLVKELTVAKNELEAQMAQLM